MDTESKLTVADSDGNHMEIICKSDEQQQEWYDSLRFAITLAPAYRRMSSEGAFEWLTYFRNQSTPLEQGSSDVEHLACLKDIQMNFLVSKIQDFENAGIVTLIYKNKQKVIEM